MVLSFAQLSKADVEAAFDSGEPMSNETNNSQSFAKDDNHISDDPQGSQQQHTRTSTWSGSFSEFFGAKRSSLGNKPPAAPRRMSLEKEKETYHERNRQFLERAGKERSKMLPPPAPFPNRAMSPASRARKRLESIDEAQPKTATIEEGPWVHHERANSDEVSEMTSLSWFSNYTGSSITTTFTVNQEERLSKFEQDQDNKFEQTKEHLQRKLSAALDGGNGLIDDNQKRELIKVYMDELDRERDALLEEWKAEWAEEREVLSAPPLTTWMHNNVVEPMLACLAGLEVTVANLPLTIGAVGLSWVTMGTVWFKFMEENEDFCVPVHFYSPRCTFGEYPGCFECDTTHPMYKLALDFHMICSCVAGGCCALFLLKVFLAWKAVVDDLSNPTTSTPIGVWCIAMVCVFAGRGEVGEWAVIATSVFHFGLSIWFLYMAIVRFGLWPDPGWFPNTVGLTYAAVKTFLYFPKVGLVLLAFAVIFFFSTFFISVARVALNKKIAAPVAWIGLSAPSITMYALTLVSQPTPHLEQMLETNLSLKSHHKDWMTHYYLPFQHLMMFLSIIGLISAIHALWSRWGAFRKKPFSPAHVAFCFPTLSHTNAVQAYRSSVNAFSSLPADGLFRRGLFVYWVLFLVVGTILNLLFTYMYVVRLPQWTKVDTVGEDEPPPPEHTFVGEMLVNTDAHEMLEQPFMSPAVIQANEAGTMIRVRRGTEDFRIHGPYMRTRKVSAFGFDPTMSDEELRQERAELLDWVAKNAPRKRNRTMSNPLFLQGGGQGGLYGSFGQSGGHKRSATSTGVPGV